MCGGFLAPAAAVVVLTVAMVAAFSKQEKMKLIWSLDNFALDSFAVRV